MIFVEGTLTPSSKIQKVHPVRQIAIGNIVISHKLAHSDILQSLLFPQKERKIMNI